MKKIIIRLLIILILAAGIVTAVQRRQIEKKRDIREVALLYFYEEDYSKSIQYLEESLSIPNMFTKDMDRDMTCYMAESYYHLGEYEKAISIYNQLLKEEPKNSMYYMLKGECYEGAEDQENAIKVYEDAWKKTSDANFLENICNLYMQQGNYENALTYAKNGIDLDKKKAADFMYMVVVIYERSQDYQAAYDAVCQYCEKYPDDERASNEKTFLESRI